MEIKSYENKSFSHEDNLISREIEINSYVFFSLLRISFILSAGRFCALYMKLPSGVFCE
jgi:hypothetical protein